MELLWRSKGACKGLNADVFFPATDDPGLEAKAVCSQCPVRQPCLEYALNKREHEGVWGGATEKERRRILRQRRKTAAA